MLRGFDMSHGVPHLILFRFANEIVVFWHDRPLKRGNFGIWDRLVAELPKMGPVLNAAKTFRSTTQTGTTTDYGVTLPGSARQRGT